MHVARLMQIQCHGYMIYSNCNMNEGIRNIYELYYNKLAQVVAVNL
jgi:hypothetical protein